MERFPRSKSSKPVRGEGDYRPEWGYGAAYRSFYDIDLNQDFFLVAHGEHRLAAQLFEPAGTPRGSAVVVHGYYDHVGLYGHLIRYLLGTGRRVLAYDQQGHGLSTGAAATIESFDHYVDALEAVLDVAGHRLIEPVCVVAQSMGAAVVMQYLKRPSSRDFIGAALLAPLVRPANWRMNRLVYMVARHLVASVGRGWVNNTDNPEFIELLRNDPLQCRRLPVQWVTAMVEWMYRFEASAPSPLRPLVVQGGRDKTVDGAYNIPVLRRIYDMELLEIPQARHHLVNETEDIRRQMWRFFDARL